MRSVLIVFGIAIGILIVAIIFTPSKGLLDNPSEVAYEKSQEFNRQEQAEANKNRPAAAKPATSTSAATAADSSNPPAAAPVKFEPYKLPAQGSIQAVMSVKGRGDVTFELFSKDAPKTVAQIAGLMKSGFFDGILVHRVESGFVVQFGNAGTKTLGPDAPETDGGVPTIPFETNSLKHDAGTLGIALTAANSDTGTSQVFINMSPNHNLDGKYCVFGRVASGMDVVAKIQAGDKIDKIVVK